MDYGVSPVPDSIGTLPAHKTTPSRVQQAALSSLTKSAELFARHEGGVLSRALGTAVHASLEELAHLREAHPWPEAVVALKQFEPRIEAGIRAAGIAPLQAKETTAEALRFAIGASHDLAGQWILSPHLNAASEVRWSAVLAGSVRTVQADRVFRAGLMPFDAGDDAWWIIDYKTHAATSASDPANTMAQLRSLFAPQLEMYGQALRNLHEADAPIRAGLYYPRMLLFDWWEL